MKLNKKGQKLGKGMLETAVVFIVLIVLFLSIYAVLVPEAQTAGDSMNDSQLCLNVGCNLNESGRPTDTITCYAGSPTSDNATCGTVNQIPLASLFSGTGIIFVVIMAGLLIVLIGGALVGMKKKK